MRVAPPFFPVQEVKRRLPQLGKNLQSRDLLGNAKAGVGGGGESSRCYEMGRLRDGGWHAAPVPVQQPCRDLVEGLPAVLAGQAMLPIRPSTPSCPCSHLQPVL
jgi:hypothetical protein